MERLVETEGAGTVKAITALALDTSGSRTYCSLAVLNSDGLREEQKVITRSSPETMAHSEQVHGLMDAVLSEAEVELAAVDAFVVVSGPGSFTGLRIGFSYLQGLCVGLRTPLVAVPTHVAAYRSYCLKSEVSEDGAIVLSDARRKEWFCTDLTECKTREEAATHGGSFPVPESLHPQIVTDEQLMQRVSTAAAPQVIACSVAAEPADVIRQRVEGAGGGVFEINDVTTGALSVASASLCGEQVEPFSVKAVAAMTPLYVRGVNARSLAERGVDRPFL